MLKTTTYALYTGYADRFVKLATVDERLIGRNKNITFKISLLDRTKQALAFTHVDVFCWDDIKFTIRSLSPSINLRTVYCAKSWDSKIKYIPGDAVMYTGKAYVLMSRLSVGVSPEASTSWVESETYSSTKIYNTNNLVLYSDGKYYISTADGNLGNKPGNSSVWQRIQGEYGIFAHISESGSKIETEVVTGFDHSIQLIPYSSEIYYTNDSSTTTIEGVAVRLPKMIKENGSLLVGYSNAIMPSQYSNITLTPNNKTGESRYYKVATARMVNNSVLSFNLEIENLYFSSLNISGKVKVVIIGGDSSRNMRMSICNCSAAFIVDNIQLDAYLNGTNIDFYLRNKLDIYKVKIEDMVTVAQDSEFMNLTASQLYTHQTITPLLQPVGTKLVSLF